MAKRENDPRLQKLFDEKKNVYSISKLNCIDQCLYQAYCTYILKDRGLNNCYGIMGSKIHDVLEAIINGDATEKELTPALQAELNDLNMLDIEFPNENIKTSWISDMTHLCNNFVKPKGEFTTEELVIYKINEDRYVQGYLDLIQHNKDNTISIWDWKTSSQFSKEDLLHHGRQLVFYALAKEQEGETVKSVGWIMLKYCQIDFMGKARSNSKNETLITKICNRSKIIKELQSYIESDLAKLGYDEVDIEILINEALENNSFDKFPVEIRNKYIVKPYVRKYEITEELKKETLDYINNIADIYESKTKDKKEWTFRKLTNDKGKDDTFFCNVLCSHRKSCPEIKKHNELKIILQANDEELF